MRVTHAVSMNVIRNAIRVVAASIAVHLLTVGLAHAQQAAATQKPNDATAAIRDAARSYQDALTRGDGKTLAALWTPDGDIVDDEGRVLNGRETVSQITAATTEAPRPTFRIEETNLRFLTPDVAIEDGTVAVTPPGAAAALSGWFSATWVRHDGAWKLTGLRESRISSPHDTPRLADLDWMVGDWTVVEDHPDRQPAAGALPLAPGGRPPIEVSVRWNPTRTFLLRDMKIAVAKTAGAAGGEAGDSPPEMHLSQRIGWDPLSRQIVSWSFGSDGSHGEATWTRDGSADGTTWIARTMAVMPDGSQTSALNIYAYDGVDRCTWRSVPTHVGGEHAPHVTMTMIRKKSTASPPPGSPGQ